MPYGVFKITFNVIMLGVLLACSESISLLQR